MRLPTPLWPLNPFCALIFGIATIGIATIGITTSR
jgi:hypothetical protein